MARRRRHTPPFDLQITGLGDKGLGRGEHEGQTVLVRGAPPGAVVRVAPFKRKKGVLHARRTALVEAPPHAVEPRCAVFGLCGGCTLQELPYDAQLEARAAYGVEQVAPGPEVVVHPPVGAPSAYAYRNKVELSFSVRRYLSEEAHAAEEPIEGRWLGFHAPGRFDRVVDTHRCELVSEALNAIVGVLREQVLAGDEGIWDHRAHTGFWRHVVLRESSLGQRLVVFYTAPGGDEDRMRSLAAALPDVHGVVWYENASVGDAARGELRSVLRGRPWIEERLGARRFRLSPTSFFQTNTAGALRLYDVVREAAGGGTRLLDLYCGTGSIGLYLADDFEEVVGVELDEGSVRDARANAERNGLHATFHSGAVEAVVEALGGGDVVVVDPPRAGLHPKAARWLAQLDARVLVYVACKPSSLARDAAILAAGGWHMRDLWTVDLFPHTGHVEAVARFVRPSPAAPAADPSALESAGTTSR